jgi:hypothetical protein
VDDESTTALAQPLTQAGGRAIRPVLEDQTRL